MCKVCDEVKGLDQKAALEKVGAAMKLPKAKLDHLSDLTDKILKIPPLKLGEVVTVKDPELAGTWKDQHQQQNEGEDT